MNSRNKKILLWTTTAVVSVTLFFVVLYQRGYIVELKNNIIDKDAKLVKVSLQLDEQKALTSELAARVEVLQDSIVELTQINQALQTKIVQLKNNIERLNKALGKQEEKVKHLTKQIKEISENGKVNQSLIAELEKERDKILKEMEANDRERIELIRWKEDVQKKEQVNNQAIEKANNEVVDLIGNDDPLPITAPEPVINQSPTNPDLQNHVSPDLQNQIKNRQQERLAKIIANTTVEFTAISLKNREEGNDLKKIKENEDGWRYTFIDFNLDNLDRSAILDETFLIQVFDLDNNEVVPFNEKNMAFPHSEMGAGGYKFKYNGNQVSIRYINTQTKKGKNYEIRLFYFKNGLSFPLDNGTRKIVVDGIVAVD